MVATPGPRAPVQPPVILPPLRSLLTAIPPTTLEDGAAAGIAHVQGRGLGVQGPYDWCGPGSISITDACGVGNRNSFLIAAGELRPSQSTFAAGRYEFADRLASAQVNLETHRSYVIAKELLYGAATTAGSWGNPFLTDSNVTPVTLAAQPVHGMFDRILDAWGDRLQGERGLIHMPPAIARAGVRTQQLVERGNQLVEPVSGFQVVTDAAYANAAMSSATEDPLSQVSWIFVSPNIDIRLSQIVFTPASEADMNWALDRASNILTVRAMQVVSYTYEQPAGTLPNNAGNPPVLAIPVDLCTADCIPGAS